MKKIAHFLRHNMKAYFVLSNGNIADVKPTHKSSFFVILKALRIIMQPISTSLKTSANNVWK